MGEPLSGEGAVHGTVSDTAAGVTAPTVGAPSESWAEMRPANTTVDNSTHTATTHLNTRDLPLQQ